MRQHLEIERPQFRVIEPGGYIENEFYSKAVALRHEFEKAILDENAQNAGLTPLSYAYYKDAYQFLTAGAERCFSEDLMADLIQRLQKWAGNALGASHVSTPQVRVYVRGCSRNLLPDKVITPWHFLLSLTSNHSSKNSFQVRILPGDASGVPSFRFPRVLRFFPTFNQLLVHRTREPYSIQGMQASMNPLEGTVFLDGYMW